MHLPQPQHSEGMYVNKFVCGLAGCLPKRESAADTTAVVTGGICVTSIKANGCLGLECDAKGAQHVSAGAEVTLR